MKAEFKNFDLDIPTRSADKAINDIFLTIAKTSNTDNIKLIQTDFSKNDVQLSEHLANITEICDYNAKVLGLQYEKPQIVIGSLTLEEHLACRNIGKVYDAIHQTFDLYLSH